MTPPRNHWRHVRASLGLLAIVVLITLAVGVFAGSKAHQLTTKVGGPHGTPVQTITVPEAAVDQAIASDVADHEGAKDETPVGAPHSVIEAAREQQDRLAANDQLPIVTPDAAPEQRGCATRLVGNFSSRRGVRPRIFVLHYTVSANRDGTSDVIAIVTIFDRLSFAASSNYVLDGEGNCAYIVRESDKAWTQAALNPVSISAEIINTGHEPTYIKAAGLRKLAMVISDSLKRWEIPLQLGKVVGGVVVKPGVVDHGMLGVAGGGHHDISPYSVTKVIDAVKTFRAAATAKAKAATAKAKAAVRAKLRRQIVALRKAGFSWRSIQATPLWARYVKAGGR